MPVQIHGNQYVTVAERLKEAGKRLISLNTEVVCVPNSDAVVIKATVNIDGNTFTGISAANPSKTIEKSSPYEVAETSAVGRALGFAGFGVIDSIASADEMVKATSTEKDVDDEEWMDKPVTRHCSVHDVDMPQKWSEKKQKNYWAHITEDGKYCFGSKEA